MSLRDKLEAGQAVVGAFLGLRSSDAAAEGFLHGNNGDRYVDPVEITDKRGAETEQDDVMAFLHVSGAGQH